MLRFFGGSFNRRDNVRPQSNLEDKNSSIIFEVDFLLRIDPLIFKPIPLELFDWSKPS